MNNGGAQLEASILKIQKGLLEIGFSEEEAEKQINDLGELVLASAVSKVAEKEFPGAQPSPSEVKSKLDKLSQEELGILINEAGMPVVSQYLEAITQNLSEDQKNNFYSDLK